MSYLIPDRAYQIIKWVCALVLPALATLVGTVGTAWGMDASLVSAIVTTITAVATFGGAIIGLSAATATGETASVVADSTDASYLNRYDEEVTDGS